MARGNSRVRRGGLLNVRRPSSTGATFTTEDVRDQVRRVKARQEERVAHCISAHLNLEPQTGTASGGAALLPNDPLPRLMAGMLLAQEHGRDKDITPAHVAQLLNLMQERHDAVNTALRGAVDAPCVDDPFQCISDVTNPNELSKLAVKLEAVCILIECDMDEGMRPGLPKLVNEHLDVVRELAVGGQQIDALEERVGLLVADGKIGLARRVIREFGFSGDELSVDDEQQLKRLCEAAVALGERPEHLRLIYSRKNLREAFSYASEPQSADPRAPGKDRRISGLPPAKSPAEALTRAHAILREPYRFLDGEQPVNHDLMVRIDMTRDAYRELYASLRENAAWVNERVIVDADTPNPIGLSRYRIGVGTQLRAKLGQHGVGVEFATHLAVTDDPTSMSALDLARDTYGDGFAACLHPPDGTTASGQSAYWRHRGREISHPTLASSFELLGPDHCDHPDAEWKLHKHRFSSYLSLRCPRCLRERIAVRPALLDITTEKGRERFRREQVAQQILAGTPRNEDTDALIAAARAIPDDPGAHATHLDASTSPKRRPLFRAS